MGAEQIGLSSFGILFSLHLRSGFCLFFYYTHFKHTRRRVVFFIHISLKALSFDNIQSEIRYTHDFHSTGKLHIVRLNPCPPRSSNGLSMRKKGSSPLSSVGRDHCPRWIRWTDLWSLRDLGLNRIGAIPPSPNVMMFALTNRYLNQNFPHFSCIFYPCIAHSHVVAMWSIL